MKPKPFMLRSRCLESSVIKITYGKKFVIAKCKNQSGYLLTMEKDLNAFLRGGINNPEGLYFHFYNYIKKHPDLSLDYEQVIQSGNGYLLLKTEQELLDKGLLDKNFMNNQVSARIPEYNEETQMYGWITRSSVLHFQKWLKTRKKDRRKSAA